MSTRRRTQANNVSSASTSTAVVLGGGGIVGMAYHVGVLAAFEDAAGFDARTSDLLVGTSAGSVIAAILRGGTSASELRVQLETPHERDSFLSDEQVMLLQQRPGTDPLTAMRRRVGSLDLAARTFGWPVPPRPPMFRALFPAGIRSADAILQRWSALFPPSWPVQPLYICAYSVRTRRRVVFGSRGAPDVAVAAAVHASGAIPWMYPPITVDGDEIVDGGLASATHLDLAAGHDAVIAIVPAAYDRRSPHPPRLEWPLQEVRLYGRWMRRYAARHLPREAEAVRAAGGRVALVRPTRLEADKHGIDLMDGRNRRRVADKAYRETVRALEQGGHLSEVIANVPTDRST